VVLLAGQTQELFVSFKGKEVTKCAVMFVRGVDISYIFKKKFGDFKMTALCWRPSIFIRGGYVCSVFNENLNGLEMAVI
jgi:hypothetical protein